jgi:pimeloyl-ACP methyl ester carboxylesterase
MSILRKILKIFSTTLLIGLAVLFVALFLFDRLVQFRDSDHELISFFKKKNIHAAIGYYYSEGRKLRHIAIGNPKASVCILFLHGSPSSLSYFKQYFINDTLLQQAYMLAVDRPGYGYSGFGRPETSIEKQARMIRPLLDSLHQIHHPVIVVGVSYGTSVACRLTIDYPDLVDGLVLLAPSLAPGEEKTYAVAYPIQFPFLQWAVPRMLLSANAEKLSHRKELEKMQPYWSQIKVPVSYLQGADDKLIYPANAIFARKKLINAACLDIQMLPNRGHLIILSEIKKINHIIIDMTRIAGLYYKSKKKNS